MDEVRVEGLRELRAALLRTIPAEVQGKALQKSLTAGTRLTVAAAKMKAPVKTGRMRKAIYATRDRASSRPGFEARVVAVKRGKKAQKSNRDAFYWKFVEFGHRTGTKKTGYLRKSDRSSGGYAGGTGFVAARPFMRPAFDSTKAAALDAIRDGLKKQVEAAAKKARW